MQAQPDQESLRQELALPGAQADPCCMGTEARELAAVLDGFGQEALADGSWPVLHQTEWLLPGCGSWAAGQISGDGNWRQRIS